MRVYSGPNDAVAQPPPRLLPSSVTRPTLTCTARFGVPSDFPTPAGYLEEFRGLRPDGSPLPGAVPMPESAAAEFGQTAPIVGSGAVMPTALSGGSTLSSYETAPENYEAPMVDAYGMVNAVTELDTQQSSHGVLAVAPLMHS